MGTAAPDYTTQQGIPAQFSLCGPDGQYEVDYFATGNDGLSESSNSNIAVLDNTPPVIGIASPNSGSPYTVNQIVAASYSCTDAGSGLATCVGSVANGSSIDTATVGSKSFTVNATDKLANASASIVSRSAIRSAWRTTHQRQRRTAYLFKLQLCDANDVNVSNVNIVITATGVDGDPTKAIALGRNPGNMFLYGPGTAPGASYTSQPRHPAIDTDVARAELCCQGDPTPHSSSSCLETFVRSHPSRERSAGHCFEGSPHAPVGTLSIPAIAARYAASMMFARTVASLLSASSDATKARLAKYFGEARPGSCCKRTTT